MEQAKLQEFEERCIQEEPAECVAACPLHVDARSFVIEMARGAWAEAWLVLNKTMPLPSVLGRICDHPCELRCKRTECGESIRIGALERACVQTPPAARKTLPMPRRGKRVAVFGSGLSSLTAASDLLRKGYPVTVFEPTERLGGWLLELPAELLPPKALEAEVEVLKKLGVEFRVGTSPALEELAREFNAVYWGLDGHAPVDLRVDDATMQVFHERQHNVFAGGAGSSGASTAHVSPIGAAFDGRRAATSIDRALQGASLSAGREKEGPQPTRLFVSLAGFDPNSAIVPAESSGDYSLEEAQREAGRCLRCECLECVKVCEYLRQFGHYPRRHARDIYNNFSFVQGDHKANLLIDSCMLCDLCTTVCPEDFSMPDLCLGARRELIGRGKMPPSAYEFALEDFAWSRSDAFALSRNEPSMDSGAYAFFPGCQLAGSNPAQVEALYDHLRSSLRGGVGLILDCCGAPPHWAGRDDLFEQGVADILRRWEGLGRPILVFACPTCLAMLEHRLPEGAARFLSEVLEERALPAAPAGEQGQPIRALHDPCTTRHNRRVQESVRRLLATLEQPVEELALSREVTECCGYGGLEYNANPDLARAVAKRRGGESANEFVTYCAMCRDNLMAAGKRTIHLLDLLYPVDDDPAGRSRPGWSERRENRSRLRERLLASVWREGGPEMEQWQTIELFVSPQVQERLDERRILLEDVRRVIHHAETGGDKLCDRRSGLFLASYRPRAVTFWVEYSPREGGFEVRNAYSHRMAVQVGGS